MVVTRKERAQIKKRVKDRFTTKRTIVSLKIALAMQRGEERRTRKRFQAEIKRLEKKL